MMVRVTAYLRAAFFVITLLAAGSSEHDLFLEFCGQWRHGKDPLSLDISVSPGCAGISVSANESSLSVKGSITAKCQRTDVIPLNKSGFASQGDTDFCLLWEPLLDQMMLEVGGRTLILCPPSSPAEKCCTDLSQGVNHPNASYGIVNGRIRTDHISHRTMTGYSFTGQNTSCKVLCDQANQTYVKGFHGTKHPCALRSEETMTRSFRGQTFTSNVKWDKQESSTTVYIPRSMAPATSISSAVSVTFYKNNSLFEAGYNEVKLLRDVVEITVGNEVIANLSEPIKIVFKHDVISRKHKRRCVSWDTRKDPLKVNWLVDGCKTIKNGDQNTECLCDHLTYFSVLVQLEPGPVRHLLPLTVITSVGCAASFFSCIAVMVFFCRNRRRSKEQSVAIHLGLASSLAFLSLLFFFTGVLVSAEGNVCTWVGAMLHYALLSSLTWMGIEVFNTFWLVYMVFRPSPRPAVWYLIGFAFPVVPVVALAAVGDIYGVLEIANADDVSEPYHMCWMKITEQKALLAHFLTTMTLLAILVLSGIIMLFLVYREIRTRDEWKQNRVAFFSIWGLSCLFGTTWGLTFLKFDPLADFILFFSCFLNSFQGFFLMLRFCMLDWIRKQADRSVLSRTSSGSAKQHMLQNSEKR
ncbi:adhesion G-protein coupled receptor G5-like isoform 2-T2 [Fundulus diaphanus]